VFIETFGTNKTELSEIDKFVYDNFDFSVDNIINELDLRRPIYYDLACYGHFGRDGYSWENKKDIH
jgi:S-adenosylmethionine synthetase